MQATMGSHNSLATSLLSLSDTVTQEQKLLKKLATWVSRHS